MSTVTIADPNKKGDYIVIEKDAFDEKTMTVYRKDKVPPATEKKDASKPKKAAEA